MMNQRSIAMLHKILEADDYISEKTLSELFNVSRRTIYNDLDKINDWLKQTYATKLRRVREKGLYLESQEKKRILEDEGVFTGVYYEYSKTERRAWTFIFLAAMDQDYFLRDFQDAYQVSRNTVIEDIKSLKEELAKSDLGLISNQNGYKLYGDEIAIREYIVHYVMTVTPQETWFAFLDGTRKKLDGAWLQTYKILSLDDIYHIKRYLEEYEKSMKLEITDDVRNNLVMWFYFFVKRIKHRAYANVDAIDKKVIRTTEEFNGAEKLCGNLARYYDITFPNSEVVYFSKYLLSAKVNYNFNLQLESREMKNLNTVVGDMVDEFQRHAAVDFPERRRMIHNLLLHLKTTYYRKKYGLQIQSVFKNEIKTGYPEIFHLTQMVIHYFETFLEQEISENEIGFIAMHFGGWLRKEGVYLEARKKKMLIVCTSGLGTSQLLESQLTGLFSDIDVIDVISLREYEQKEELLGKADFIVSTIALPDKGIPVFVVRPILSNSDKLQLLRSVNHLFNDISYEQNASVGTIFDMVSRYADIHDEQALKQELNKYFNSSNNTGGQSNSMDLLKLMPENRVDIRSVNDWEDAIRKAAIPLRDEGFITENYVENMIQIVKDDGPYMVISDLVTLSHAKAESGVNKTGMSMLLLTDERDMHGKPIKLVIVLAAVDNEQHLKGISELTKLFSNKSVKNSILKSRSKEELYYLIKTNLNNLKG